MGELENLGSKGGPGQPKKIFDMRLETSMPATGETPHDVDDLLGSLRDRSLIKEDFPVIELKDLKTSKASSKGGEAIATYSIICVPPSPKAAAAKAKK
jgi:hypothetical protein